MQPVRMPWEGILSHLCLTVISFFFFWPFARGWRLPEKQKTCSLRFWIFSSKIWGPPLSDFVWAGSGSYFSETSGPPIMGARGARHREVVRSLKEQSFILGLAKCKGRPLPFEKPGWSWSGGGGDTRKFPPSYAGKRYFLQFCRVLSLLHQFSGLPAAFRALLDPRLCVFEGYSKNTAQ